MKRLTQKRVLSCARKVKQTNDLPAGCCHPICLFICLSNTTTDAGLTARWYGSLTDRCARQQERETNMEADVGLTQEGYLISQPHGDKAGK